MITDDMLALAAEELANAINDSLPDPAECTHQFSVGFEKKIKRIICKANHPIIYRTLRSVASIILVIILGFSSVLTVNAEVREIVFGWIKEHYESFYEYFFEGDINNTEKAKYSLGWIPEKYTLATFYEIADGEAFVYLGSDDKMIQFAYSHSVESASFFVDGEEYETEEVVIGSSCGDVFITTDNSKTNGIVWTNDENVIFFISAPLEADDLIKMAESIEKNKS